MYLSAIKITLAKFRVSLYFKWNKLTIHISKGYNVYGLTVVKANVLSTSLFLIIKQ